MAKANGTTIDSKTSAALFEAFSWLKKEHQTSDTDVLELAKDIAGGVALTLQIIEQSRLDREYGIAVLSVTDCGYMERFAISACKILHDTIEEHFQLIDRKTAKKGGE